MYLMIHRASSLVVGWTYVFVLDNTYNWSSRPSFESQLSVCRVKRQIPNAPDCSAILRVRRNLNHLTLDFARNSKEWMTTYIFRKTLVNEI